MIVFRRDRQVKELGGGVSRRILAENEKIMTVEVSFEKGAVGAPHSHSHEQISYVLSGKFEAKIGEDVEIIEKGDSYVVEGGVEHSVVCLEAGALLDVFTPRREDFLK